MSIPRRTSPLILLLALLACGPSSPATRGGPATNTGLPERGAPPTAESRTLVIAIRGEPSSLSTKEWVEGLALGNVKRFFGAYLTIADEREEVRPYLAEALPVLNSDSWILFPDGRMETRYHLKPNLVWHDGVPLTADDFVFAFQIGTPANGFRTSVAPYTMMQEVVAPDDRSLLIRWKSIYPEGDSR